MDFSVEEIDNFIRQSMEQAELAIAAGNPPFGAVLVNSNKEIIVKDFNKTIQESDMTCHAEINIIREIAKRYGDTKLSDYSIFINAASCGMCASALIKAGVRNFFYGAPIEVHTNPVMSYAEIAKYCKTPIHIHGGILEEQCKEQISRGRTKIGQKKERASGD